jgi:hypothetical protein
VPIFGAELRALFSTRTPSQTPETPVTKFQTDFVFTIFVFEAAKYFAHSLDLLS